MADANHWSSCCETGPRIFHCRSQDFVIRDMSHFGRLESYADQPIRFVHRPLKTMSHFQTRMTRSVERHVIEMLSLSLKKHREAVALISPARGRSREDIRRAVHLLDETELLLNDVSTYVNSIELELAIDELKNQQSLMRFAQNSMEHVSPDGEVKGLGYLFLALVLCVQLVVALY